ncbi:NAD-dependent epimerase/dehydratase family protein [Allokutzneria albata]|uniref:Nucleoside-diphosphate-sugar epimerase n=1 Tax=Allokutzneria albata TaxID=211114 RepID=A0A1H0D9K0_ALLAB|nr:NAD-dependent epimerase/dehydratase family protein [Allokutzneria albata]SDN66887.1 Nucleoside-diphosphate-sugar epimerase [Allokutzneria albata]
MTRILLLGATGFLGSHVHNVLFREPGVDVVTVARSALSESPGHVPFDLGLADVGALRGLITAAAPDVVINCVGAAGGSVTALAESNVELPARIVRALLECPKPPRLVHLGSAAEYGRGEIGVPVTEDTPPAPVGAYGLSKLAGTRAVGLGRAAGLDTVVLRVFNPIGPGSPTSGLAGRAAAEIIRARRQYDGIRLGPLDVIRDFVDARDVARAVFAAATTPSDAEILNVGSGVGTPAEGLVAELARIAGHTGPVSQEDRGPERPADVPWQRADVSEIGRVLGWRPEHDLTDSLTALWREVACHA